MNIEILTEFFGWAAVINMGLLFFSTFAVIGIREFAIKTHSRLFKISEEELGKLYFEYIAQFKVLTIIFFVVPYIALKIVSQ